MSAKDSNLSSPGFQYDLVSAVTQDALNANLKAFTAAIGEKAEPFIQYYKYTDSFHTEVALMTDEEVLAMTGGQDIFAIPDKAQSDLPEYSAYKALGDAMAAANFAYAFNVGFGLPAGISPAKMPDIISLYFDSSRVEGKDLDQTVEYNLYFASFVIMEMAYGGKEWKVRKTEQQDNEPWIFRWLVNLNLQIKPGTSYSSLPPNVQENLKKVYNINPESMFSLQQLLLDLNTPQLNADSITTVINVPPNSPLYTSLYAFLNSCWFPYIENGGIVLTNSVQPEIDNYPASSIIPTDLNFVVTPYADAANYGLYTLNYLVMSHQNKMPSPIQPFSWNWVDDKSVQGVMSVRRAVFVDYLNQVLSPCLNPICPKVDVVLDDAIFTVPDGSINLKANTDTLRYTQNQGNPYLTFSYKSEDQDDESFDLVHNETLKVCVEVHSEIRFFGNTITCETMASVYYRNIREVAAIDVSDVTRYELAQRNTTVFTLDAVGTGVIAGNSTAGLLQVSCRSTNENLIQTQDVNLPYYGGDNSFLSRYLTLGKIGDYEAQVTALAQQMNALMDAYTRDISNIIDGEMGFVFPGAQTYYFADPAFSDQGDLTVRISFQ
ncbi:hypothetical protein U0035_02675 [Niabella yanshanensis]|uniref:Uncharacterized protein n=1 Tax=Niabella yanshanensis TaxID=577386 RepID=A0ABZ0W779_9BACT|nr:hypothetical protein [Niabella yanshanensis]WQD39051.1 hypothetical protein U0035_02675 [Niabella yanshanensis]